MCLCAQQLKTWTYTSLCTAVENLYIFDFQYIKTFPMSVLYRLEKGRLFAVNNDAKN